MNVQQRIGGDSDLSRRGWAYARKLPEYFAKELPPDLQMTVWTSTFKRTRQTGQFLPYPHVEWRALDELDAGVCDGLTYEEIEVRRRARTPRQVGAPQLNAHRPCLALVEAWCGRRSGTRRILPSAMRTSSTTATGAVKFVRGRVLEI